MLKVLQFMGFIEEDFNERDLELVRTVTNMLSDLHLVDNAKAVRRSNLFRFLLILCDIKVPKSEDNDD